MGLVRLLRILGVPFYLVHKYWIGFFSGDPQFVKLTCKSPQLLELMKINSCCRLLCSYYFRCYVTLP